MKRKIASARNAKIMFQVINFKEDLVMQILKAIWDFFQNQILGMRWLNELVGNGLSALGFDTANR